MAQIRQALTDAGFYMLRLFCSIIISVFLLNAAYACDSPEKTMTLFLKYDFDGERMGADVALHIDNYTDDPYESAWDQDKLIAGYSIRSIRQDKQSAVVTVAFKDSWATDRNFDPAEVEREEIVEANLRLIEGCWKVVSQIYMPHVNPFVVLRHYERLLESAIKEGDFDEDYISYTRSVTNSIRQYIDKIKPVP